MSLILSLTNDRLISIFPAHRFGVSDRWMVRPRIFLHFEKFQGANIHRMRITKICMRRYIKNTSNIQSIVWFYSKKNTYRNIKKYMYKISGVVTISNG